jgi:prepilin-type N-terminal cleavage/methylation domain-containing protein
VTIPRRTAKRDRHEDGFTLIELIMAITISALILGTLSFSITEGFQNAGKTKTSIDRSLLGSFTARYFSADIASASFGPGAIVTTNPPICGVGTSRTIIDIQTSAITAVSYAMVTETNGQQTLVRRTCSGTVTGALTQIDSKHLGTTDAGLRPPMAACASTTSCSLLLQWTTPTYSVTVSGTRWVNATAPVAP